MVKLNSGGSQFTASMRKLAGVHALRVRTLELMQAAGEQCRELADVGDRARRQRREVPLQQLQRGILAVHIGLVRFSPNPVEPRDRKLRTAALGLRQV
jgi:hypothetical protein